jgi:superfamily II DNA or RNA helicase
MADDLHLPNHLWAHQRRAVEVIDEYLVASSHNGRSALITMPTGTGKTGVIASSVAFPPSLSGHRLILTPWDALVRQLMTDLDSSFWTRLGMRRPDVLPPVRRLPPSSRVDDIVGTEQPTVFVATIAAIRVMAEHCAAQEREIADVFADFDVVVVDEGHYEPAHRWSDAIRSLRRPMVLLTATPYRNDEKFFWIGDWRYRFAHHEAVARRFLRTPSFDTITRRSPIDFAAELVGVVSEQFSGEDSVRVIVRCAEAGSIIQAVHAFTELGRSAIGIHHTFQSGDDRLRRAVPPPEATDAQFWVHQNKLIEGIDDPRFKVIAFYDPLRNDRAVVQQIGRVLRNPKRRPSEMKALVIGTGARDPEATWDAYLRFDRQDTPEAAATLPDLTERVLAAQPEAFYYDGAYRVRIDLTDEGAWRSFAFPLRTRVFREAARREAMSLAQLASATEDEWKEIDRSVFPAQIPTDDAIVIPYVTAENSPLLRTGTFVEPVFGFTVMRRTGDLLFLYDARGRTPQVVLDRFRPLKPSELTMLFPAGAASLTSVALLNTDIGRQVARGRQLRAAAIDELGPDLSDYGYVCTIAEGYTEISNERFRRYVGLSRARVVDHRAGDRDFASYSAWLDELGEYLRGPSASVDTFTRYAREAAAPDDPEPVHVLLDVDPTGFERPTPSGTLPLELEEVAYEVTGGIFRILANGNSHDATLRWDSLMERYELGAPSLSAEAFHERGGDERELVAHINRTQSLRIVPAERRQIYTHGHFYEPVVPVRRAGGFRLLDVLVTVPELDDATSEKGNAITGDDWAPDSVFGMISALEPDNPRDAPDALAEILPSPDLLVCTDMGTEVADFMATSPGRAVFMHAKASANKRLASASALHDIAAQAIKNLPYLQPLSDDEPKSKNWMSRWKASGVEGEARRQRVGAFASTAEIWQHMRSVISDPQAEREVWLLLARSLSRSALEHEARKRPPPAEALQVFSLLQTTWGAVSQLGARLRIFCSP